MHVVWVGGERIHKCTTLLSTDEQWNIHNFLESEDTYPTYSIHVVYCEGTHEK
jgi:hypothetical protein